MKIKSVSIRNAIESFIKKNYCYESVTNDLIVKIPIELKSFLKKYYYDNSIISNCKVDAVLYQKYISINVKIFDNCGNPYEYGWKIVV